jgi:hypothetical protein
LDLKHHRKIRKRHAVAGILAALILFTMLFTVGTGYFVFVNQNNLRYTQALSTRATALQSQLNENLALAGAASGVNHLLVTAVNSGGQATTIIGLFIVNPSGGTQYLTTTMTTPPLPIALNAGTSSASIDTGITIVSGTYTIKAVTQRGATFTATYPPTAISLAAQALSSGAIGDLYIQFSTFKYYTISTCGSYQCLNPQGNGFVVPNGVTSGNIAFSVRVTDLNSLQKSMTLDSYTLLMQFVPPTPGAGGGTARTWSWYIISNSSSGQINPTYNQITLSYNTPVTIVFASSTAGTYTGYAPGIGANTITLDFIATHGCEVLILSPCSTSNENYGQTIPYVSTLYF